MKKNTLVLVVLLLAILLCMATACAKNSEAEYTLTTTSSDYNAGDCTICNSDKIVGGTEVTLYALSNPGYVFLGWYDGDSLVSTDTKYVFSMPRKNVVYTANWKDCREPEAEKFSLTTSANILEAGSYTKFSGEIFKQGAEIVLVSNTNDGYVWLGWYDGNSLVSVENTFVFNMPNKNLNYTARWKKLIPPSVDEFTISTDSNIAEAGSYTKFENEKIVVGTEVTLTVISNKGYAFIGWYNEESLLSTNNTYVFTMPNENIRYTAKWIEDTGKILSVENGTIDEQGFIVQINIAGDLDGLYLGSSFLTLQGNATWKLYHDVYGNKEIPSKCAMPESGVFKNGDNTFFIITTSADGTISRTYELIIHRQYTVEVEFVAGNKTIIRGTILTQNKLSIDDAPDASEIEEYETITGWKTADGKLWDFDNDVIKENTVLYAVGKGKTYNVTLDPNGGLLNETTASVVFDSDVSLPVPTKEYYKFGGWCLDGEKLTDSQGKSLGVWTIAQDVTLTASWDASEELENFEYVVTKTGVKLLNVKNKTVTEITVPDYVDEISIGTFSGCDVLETLTVPFIGGGNGYNHLPYIFGSENSGNVTSGNNVIPKSLKFLNVTREYKIADYAVYGCYNLKAVTILKSTIIGESAFHSCSGLEDVTIPNAKTIGRSAFNGCNNLENLYLSQKLSIINEYAFVGCYQMSITFNGTIEQWQKIEKVENWNNSAPGSVYCTDGRVGIQE